MSREIQTPNNAAAAAETTPALAPESVVAQLRTLRQQMGEVTPLTQQQKRVLRNRSGLPNGVVQASINAIGASDHVQQALGQPADEVRNLAEEVNRWTAVEAELRGMLQGVTGANLIRRQRVNLLSAQAYMISQQLARDPSNDTLLPHVEEIKRLRSQARRKKAAPQAPQPPQTPAPAVTEHRES
jgi:hypothetical protein